MKNEYSNLGQLFQFASRTYADKSAFAYREKENKFTEVSYSEVLFRATCLSASLIKLGVKYQDRVGIFSDNRIEWILADMAVILAGACDVPRGSDVTDGDIKYIISHAEIEVLFVENKTVLKKIQTNYSFIPCLKTVILMENDADNKDYLSLNKLIQEGENYLRKEPDLVKNSLSRICSEDLFTIIYTSGTTGNPKGVMLSHNNLISQIENLPIPISSEERILSILPVWHIFERIFEMVAISSGSCTYYTDVRNLKQDMLLVKPTFMASAPRLWESIYSGLMNKINAGSKFAKVLFHIGYFFSSNMNHSIRGMVNKNLKLDETPILMDVLTKLFLILQIIILWPFYKLFDLLIFTKIRKILGGNFKGTCSGGGALPLHIDEFFNNIGIPVLEGYGLTETSPVISVRTFENLVPGTVGPIYPETEVKIVDLNNRSQIYPGENGLGKRGEILVKGKQVMKGYYNNTEATENAMENGWFKTGDIGIMTYNHCLKIIGRVKETIVLLGGENVEPVPIENNILHSELVEQCMVVGQDKKFLAALVYPSEIARINYGNGEIKKRILNDIKKIISTENGFKSFEKVIDIYLLPKKFEVGEELTAKLSLKRHVITEKYTEEIENLYR
ncbi:MAG: long-chain fatty acid--CoA ligase [Leptospiraceae bacterium]|nr:long-chain fatty acid--CoA ligase [Leptospiraceae bacterium]